MNLRPRRDEVAPVVELLESGDYESSEALAEAVIKKVAELLNARDTYGVAYGLPTDDLRLPMGPYYDVRDARKAISEAREAGLTAFLAPLYSPVLPLHSGASMSRCEICRHAPQLHDRRGCEVFVNGGKCPCMK